MFKTILIFFLFAAGVVGLLASIILLFVNTNRKVTWFLGLHLLVVCLQVFYIAAWNEKTIYAFPHIFNLNHPLLLLCVPSLYLYVKGILYDQKKNSSKFYWHFLPALIVFLYYIPLYVSSSEEKVRLITDRYILFEKIEPPGFNIEILYTLILIISALVYTILILRTYLNYKKKEAAEKNNHARFLKWLTRLFGIAFFNLFVLMFAIIFIDSDETAQMLTQFVIGAHIITISLTLFLNPNILYGINKPMNLRDSPVLQSNRNKLILTEQQKDEYLKILHTYLSSNPFLRHNYSQKVMAEETKISVHHLSHLINEHYKLHYNEFINKLRIEHVLQEMNGKRWKNYSIEGISNEVGFRSKSTFISAFKKNTGTTPSNYLSKINL